MKRLFAVLATSALLSCQSSDPGASVAPEATGSIALRVQATSPLRAVDSVKVVLSYKQNQATVTVGDSVPWDRSGVKLTELPLDVSIRVRMEGWESERGRRLVYWTAETTTTLSKSSPAWDFTSGSQLVPIDVMSADVTGYVGPVAGDVALPSRGAVVGDLLKLVASPGVTDSVLFDPSRIDSVYVEGAALALDAGKYRIRLPKPDTLAVLLVGRNGLTSTLKIEVAEPPQVVHVPGLGARWIAPTPLDGAWVGDSVRLAVQIDSGKVDSVVVRFDGSASLQLQRDESDSNLWRGIWEPAEGSLDAQLLAYAVGGSKEFPLPVRNLNVDLVQPRIVPLTFLLDVPFRVGKSGRWLEFDVVETNQTDLKIWASPAGKTDTLEPETTDSGYRLNVLSGVVLHARDRVGNQTEQPVLVVLDTVGPVLRKLQTSGGADLQPGSGAVETTTGEASLRIVEAFDSANVNEVWATMGTAVARWDRQTKLLVLSSTGTWTIHLNDFLGNESVWGTVLVRYPEPARLAKPTVTPASGVYGADSLKWGLAADTLVPHVTCTEGTAQIQVDGQSWRPFVVGQEHWAMAGGEAKASYRCKTSTDSSDVVARAWMLLHQPFLTYGGVFYDSIQVHVARNGQLPNGSPSTNPASAILELCDGDSATCAAAGAVWVPVPEKDTVLRRSQSLSARLGMQDDQTGRKVYSRTLTRFYQRLSSDRVDWSLALPNNADAALLESRFGIRFGGQNTASLTEKMDDSVLELRVNWTSKSGTPFAWVELPFEVDEHPWSLVDVSSFDLQYVDSGSLSSVMIELVSDLYHPDDANTGLVYTYTLPSGPKSSPAFLSLQPGEFTIPDWGTPVGPIKRDSVLGRTQGLRFLLRGPLGGGGSATLRIHKIVLKGTMTRVAK